MKTLSTAAIVLLAALPAFARIELLLWTPFHGGPRVIIPHRSEDSPARSLETYLKALQSDPALASLRTSPTDKLLAQACKPCVADLKSVAGTDVITMVNANTVEDMVEGAGRPMRVFSLLESVGARPYLVALAAETTLTVEETREFHARLNENAALMVSLGGRDVHPHLYGEQLTHALDPNLKNDALELARVKSFKAARRGVFMGICRGHQLGAVADGHTLYQDLEKQGQGLDKDHTRKGETLRESQTWHDVRVEDSLLKRIVKSALIHTNSHHHQAVRVSADAFSLPVAYSGEVVEALQMKNGMGVSFQFHPEFNEALSGSKSFSELGKKIIAGVVAYARLKRMDARKSCRALF